jgi:NAD(P)H-dependent FMN reductase
MSSDSPMQPFAHGTTPQPPAGQPAAASATANDEPTRVLLIDASLTGPGGNCSRLLDAFDARLAGLARTVRVALSGRDAHSFASLEPRLRAADAFVFATGTHWDSWSSALQKFLEDATPAEATELWLGKPAAVLVTEHSVGGKGVLSRLQGVLLTLGCALPPFSGLVLSHAAQLARQHSPKRSAAEDFWSVEDLDVVAHNLCAAARRRSAGWRAWPVDRKDYARVWLDTTHP